MQLLTKNGHSMYDMSNMLQKAIRRGMPNLAGYAANELFGRYHKYLWKRLLTIAAEDCYGDISKEIMALKQSDEFVNQGRKGYDRDKLFVAKAVTLLLFCRKNRDGCFFACNKMLSEEIVKEGHYFDLDKCYYDGYLPDFCKDYYSRWRNQIGATIDDFNRNETAALGTGVGNLVSGAWHGTDEAIARKYREKQIDIDNRYPMPTKQQLKNLENEDFSGGTTVSYEQMDLFGGKKW